MWAKNVRRFVTALSAAATTMVLVGCLEEQTCEIKRGDTTRIECPGGSIETADELPAGTSCVEVEDGIACDSGQEFEFPEEGPSGDGEDSPPEPFEPDEYVPADVFGPGVETGNTGQDTYGCTAGVDRIRCSDGSSVATSEVPADKHEDCRSTVLPGVGRRIVCGDTEVVPRDEAGEPIDAATPTCEVVEISETESLVSCTEGSSVVTESANVDGCEVSQSSVELLENGNIVISCGAFSEAIPLEGRCGYPNGLLVDTPERAAEVLEQGCRWIYGDVTVRGLRGLSFLRETDSVSGLLVVEEMPEMVEVDQVDDGLRLFEVGGLVVRGNENLKYLDELSELRRIDGQFVVTGNGHLETIGVPVRHVGGAIIIGSNEQLEFFSRPDLNDPVPLFMFIDNTAFSWCEVGALWEWAGEHADTAYVGNAETKGSCS